MRCYFYYGFELVPPLMRSGQFDQHSANASANTCREPFTPAQFDDPLCTMLYERRSLQFKTQKRDPMCKTPKPEPWQSTAPLKSPVVDAPNECGTVMSHRDSIELIRKLGTKFVPELKRLKVPMSSGIQSTGLRRQMLAEYRQLAIPANQVNPQFFNIKDVKHWIEKHPDYVDQASAGATRTANDSAVAG